MSVSTDSTALSNLIARLESVTTRLEAVEVSYESLLYIFLVSKGLLDQTCPASTSAPVLL